MPRLPRPPVSPPPAWRWALPVWSPALVLALTLLPLACDPAPGTPDPSGASSARAGTTSSAVPGPLVAGSTSAAAPPDGSSPGTVGSAQDAEVPGQARPAGEPLTLAQFRELIEQLSEPDADFFSDNYISNETSYLQPAAPYAAAVRPGGVYVGVGPEQNFTYIALSRPSTAFVLDIRRANLVLHLFYKAIFDLARTRSEFLTLLLARPYDAETAPGPDATVEQVMAHAESQAPSKESYQQVHSRIRERIEQGYGITLRPGDVRDMRAAHRAFHGKQLDLRFELKDQNVRRYPPLRDLLAARDPEGQQRGFLVTEEAFRFVQRMEREHRIVPLVGDFGGSKALLGLADHLKRSAQTVSTFYVSNVEQYLFEGGVWHRWVRNVRALPTDDQSLFIRCYLDQGRRHPRQLKGHRTTTVLQRIADFSAHETTKPYRSMWAVSTDDWVPDGGVANAAP